MHIYLTIKKIYLIFFLCVLVSLNSCGIYKKTDARNVPTNANERVKKNMEEGRGFRLGSLGNKSTNFQFASSNPLWRASLDKLSFAPLSNVDYAGGIIVTDWFSNENSNEQIKISIRFLTNEIRTDALDVIIHKKVCDEKNNCSVNKIESTLNSEVRFAILKKAAQLKKDGIENLKKDEGEVKLPKNF